MNQQFFFLSSRSMIGISRRPGYTLIELMVSLSISAILMIGLSSALTVGLRSAQPSSQVDADLTISKTADKILTELSLARSFIRTEPNEVKFTIPSRSKIDSVDTIHYQWGEKNKFQLARSVNNDRPTIIDPNVSFFSLDYLYRDTVMPESPIIETPEYLLIEHDSTPGGSMNNFNANRILNCAQWFKPNLHPNAISWRITRVEIMIRKISDSLQFARIGIHDADPTSTWPQRSALTSVLRPVSVLPHDFRWVEFDLPDLPGLSPETGYCLVVAQIIPGLSALVVQFETATHPTSARSHWMITSNSGSGWSEPDSFNNMRFRVYGTITIQAW
jgi:prepilin-type N-terminal cleavage/methylation domain-containing protein